MKYLELSDEQKVYLLYAFAVGLPEIEFKAILEGVLFDKHIDFTPYDFTDLGFIVGFLYVIRAKSEELEHYEIANNINCLLAKIESFVNANRWAIA